MISQGRGPAFSIGNGAFGGGEAWKEVVDQVMVGVFFLHPARYGIGIVLVAVPCFVGKVAVPQSGVDFGDD